MRRRQFLGWSLAASGAAALSGCDGVYGALSRQLGAALPERLEPVLSVAPDRERRLLDRAAWGPWPGDVSRLRSQGVEGWLDEQLAPEGIDDLACTLRARRIESMHLPVAEMYEFEDYVLRDDLARHIILRAVYSRRQLEEVMLGFWLDHFNIDIGKADCKWLQTAFVRDVLRKHALGSFEELLRASARHPSMLFYLDGRLNQKRSPQEVPNENYARELLELHSLGVHGGYSQQDVMEAARCLTGWRVKSRKGFGKAKVYFDARAHDDGPKRVLGKEIPAGGGEQDLERLVAIAAHHPATARYLAWKLCRRFVAEQPPAGLVDELAGVYRANRGQIAPVLRHLFLSEAFYAAPPKLKRPLRFVISSLRSLAADSFVEKRVVLRYLERLGQMPCQYPTPDGYPDEAHTWLGGLLWRWRFAHDLASNRMGRTRVDIPGLCALVRQGQAEASEAAEALVEPLFAQLVGRLPQPAERQALAAVAAEPAQLAGLVLASPAFQFC